jgi:hypothetical protein
MFIALLMALSWSLRIILMSEGKPEPDAVLTWTGWRAGSESNDQGERKLSRTALRRRFEER